MGKRSFEKKREVSKQRKKKRQRNSSGGGDSSSSNNISNTTTSSCSSDSVRSSSSTSFSSIDEKIKRKFKKKLKQLRKKEKLKKKKKAKKTLKKSSKSKLKEKALDEAKKNETSSTSYDVDVNLMKKSKSLAPLTKEEWEKQQNTFKRVFDEETGRMRLVRGTGEIVEECVSRERHLAINKQATKGDGEFFQKKLLQHIK